MHRVVKIYFCIVAFWKYYYFMCRPPIHLGLNLYILWDWSHCLFFPVGHLIENPIFLPALTSPSCCQCKALTFFKSGICNGEGVEIFFPAVILAPCLNCNQSNPILIPATFQSYITVKGTWSPGLFFPKISLDILSLHH